MAGERASEYVAECLWPDVGDSDLAMLDQRAHTEAIRLTASGQPVRYLGSLLMREDEVVLCLFEGQLDTIREAATAAQIPFDRILEATRTPWDAHKPTGGRR
jgi:hypothetical protein